MMGRCGHFCTVVMGMGLVSTAWAAEMPDLKGTDLPPHAIRLESLDLRLVTQDVSVAMGGKSSAERPITIAGAVFAHGVGVHARSEMRIALDGQAERFVSMVGVDDETEGGGSVVFEAWVDGVKVQDSGIVRGGEPAKPFTVDLRGAKELMLLVTDAGDNLDHDHGDWAGAMILMSPDAKSKPRTLTTGAEEPVLKIASGTPDAPRINGPLVVGTTPGKPFIFLIPATGKGPLRYAAEGLPDGLSLDSATGIISGTVPAIPSHGAVEGAAHEVSGLPTAQGAAHAVSGLPAAQGAAHAVSGLPPHPITLTVTGPAGSASRRITLIAGLHKLALTPPMGWNSWNVWGCAVDDAKVRAAADAMVASGLAAHGFQYINIDDCWQAGRDADGNILCNEKFPDMKGLADYIHAKGLRFGIYSSPGPTTCAGYTASYQHEEQDARTWAAWGVDYVKYDWCSYGDVVKNPDRDGLQKPYRVMRAALDACGRDIVFSLCQYGMGEVWTWGGEVGGNLWRTTGDINDSWESMATIGFEQDKCSPYARPGQWNDPDMLVVGKVGWGPTLRETRLTRHEQITHITLWSMLAAPLLIGCDMAHMEPLTLDLLTNDEVLAVNQDPLGKAATRKAKDGEAEVWARPLHDGTTAIALFNRGIKRRFVTADFSDLGLQGTQPVRDLWQQKDLGEVTDRFTVELPRRGAVLIKVGKPTS